MTVRTRILHAIPLLSGVLALSGPALALSPGDMPLTSAPRVVVGALADEAAGSSLAAPGDLDGDGVPDLAVGAPEAGEGAGRVYLLTGAAMLDERFVSLRDAAIFRGEPGSGMGREVVAVGDMDGDGIGELALGEPGFPGNDTPEGRLTIYRGGPALWAEAPEPLVVLLGDADGARLGGVLAPAGDANGDGLADLAVLTRSGGPQSTSGRVSIVLGRAADAWGPSPSLDARVGWSIDVEGLGPPSSGPARTLANAGDLDGDGRDDLWVGLPGNNAPATRGGALLLFGGRDADGAALSEDDARAVRRFDEPEAAVGAPINVGGGRVWVGRAGPEGGGALAFSTVDGPDLATAVAELEGSGEPGGITVAWADLDGDGTASELAAQATAEAAEAGGEDAGLIAVFDGPVGGLGDLDVAFARFLGSGGTGSGAAVVVLDLDGDAYDDLLVGAPGALSTGAVYVLLGAELADGDGVSIAEGDCDDADASVSPALPELCDDGVDNDCNGFVDGLDAPCALADSGLVVGCGVAGGSAGLGGLLLLLLALRRHRPWLLLLVLPACGTADVDEPIAIRVVRDADPFRVQGIHLPVEVEITGARLAPQLLGQEGGERDVLWRLVVDGTPRGVSGGPLQVVDGLEPGVHTIDVQLVDTLAQEPLDPPVTDRATAELVSAEPSIVLLSPSADATLPPGGFDVQYEVDGFTLDGSAVDLPNQPGIGHVRVTLDGSLAGRDADGSLFVVPPQEGDFELAVELVRNDGSSLDPAVLDSAAIQVAEPRVEIIAPADGSIAVGPGVELQYSVSGFTLDPVNINGGEAEAGVGHVHVYLDDGYAGLDADGTFVLPEVNGCSHEIGVVLAQVDHQELGAFDFVSFDYEPCAFFEGIADGSIVSGPDVDVVYATRGFVLDGEDVDGPLGRHVHLYVDGLFAGTDVTGTARFTGLNSGPHTLELRLADRAIAEEGLPADDELQPEASVSVSIEVQ